MRSPRQIRLPSKDGKPAKPRFIPMHPAFEGSAKVLTRTAHRAHEIDGPVHIVNLSAGTCTCKYGAPFEWDARKEAWRTTQYCSHKIRMMADIVEQYDRPADMQIAYAKAVGSRYNMFEVVSAFHKELRRGDVDRAVFWGHMLANFRGTKGVIKYLLNIIFEETRDYSLASYLLEELSYSKETDGGPDYYKIMLFSIRDFCESPKKWTLAHRMDFLEAEMRGYSKLIKEFGRDVAKAGGIIPNSNRDILMKALLSGIDKQNMAQAQYGLKGLQKLQCADIDSHRAWIINTIHSKYGLLHDTFLMSIIERRAKNEFGIGYHELNAYVDVIFGDRNCSTGGNASGEPPKLKLGVAPQIPIYAQDNHTWAGKALIRQFPNEWLPGAKQEHMDLRLCGAYIGVVWRHLAYQQHGRIDCDWSEVKWPKWLSDTVANLWY